MATAVYDDVTECYDATRGREQRGSDFASELHRRLPDGDRPVLEVGVGTGVIALGLSGLGRNLVWPTNRIRDDDPIEPILDAMFVRATRYHPTWRRNPIGAADIERWAARAGFVTRVETFESRPWNTTSAEQMDAIRARAWPELQGLDPDTFETVTGHALLALRSLPTDPFTRRADVDIVVLELE